MKVPQNVIKICEFLKDKKAENIVVVDTTKMKNVVDFNIIVTATSTTHTKALADYVEEEVVKLNSSLELVNREGFNLSEWIILDYGELFVHIFTKQKRELFSLEKLLNEGNNLKTFERIEKEAERQEKLRIEKEKIAIKKAAQKAKIEKSKEDKKVKEKLKKEKAVETELKKKESKTKTVKKQENKIAKKDKKVTKTK